MKRLINFILINVFIVQIVAAQGEYNNWFFGSNGGLNFSTGVPVFQAGSQMNAPEGSSSISDKQGNLLMYSNGVTVWNKNHQPMPNGSGLNGDLSSSQSVVIASHPTNSTQYYIFTTDKEGGTNGFQYSMVDMSLNGGLGDVTVKNVTFNLPACEKVIAVKHKNGSDVWIITHAFGINAFFVYRITCNGLLAFPSVQITGSSITTADNTRGYMKVSPDGKKLVMANAASNVELFDFDDGTGVISNPKTITSATSPCGPYGIEFSPDSRLLYVTESCNPAAAYSILQYDLSASNVTASRVVLNTGSSNPAGALELGPDNKIYVAFDQAGFLGAIISPNTPGAGCNFQQQFVSFPAAAKSGMGLPSSLSGWRRTLLGDDTTFCDGASRVLKIAMPNTSYKWQDGSVADSFIVSAPGKYWVELNQYFNGNLCIIRDTVNVNFAPTPAFSLGKDTTVCANTLNFPLTAPVTGATYLWQDSTTASSISVKAPGLYWLQTRLNGCSFRDSVVVSSSPLPTFSLGADTTICGNQPLVIGANVPGASYLWSTGSTANSISVNTTGLYWLETSTNTGCRYRDTISLVFNPLAAAILGNDTTVCALPLTIGRAVPGATYLWQDGSVNATYPVAQPGLYWVQVSVNGCTTRDSINILGNPVTAFTLGRDTTLCDSRAFALNGPANVQSYLWSTGQTSQNININTGGTYWLKTTNASGCSYSDTINVRVNVTTSVNLGNDTVLCQLPFTIGQSIPGASYLWQDGSTNAFYSASAGGLYWVQATLNGCSSRDSIRIQADAASGINLGNDIVACSSQPVTLDAGADYKRYLWSTGSTTRSINVTGSGVYWLEAANQSGCVFRDTINITLTAAPVFSLGRDTTLCQNQVLALDVSNITGSYVWQDQSTAPRFQVTRPGTYHVSIVNNGCTRSDTISVTYKSLPAPDLGSDKSYCPGEQLTLDPKSAGTYTWQDGSRLPTIKVTQPGKYSVRVQNECGVGTDEILVTAGACSLQFPNAFTPGKRPNETFKLINGSAVKEFRLQVFNRWGQAVYQSTNAAEGWDGKYKGADQPSGMYIFVTSYVDAAGKPFTQKGTVVLIR